MSKRLVNVNAALSGLLCLGILIWQLSAPAAYAEMQPQGSSVPGPERVVLLYSYGDGIPAYQQATRGFLSVMKEGRVSVNNLFFEYLDLERKKDKEHKKNLVTLLGHKYKGKKIDLLVTVHTQALKFILSEGKDLFPGAPVLSYLAPDMIETAGIERRVLLLPMKMDFKGTLELALKLFPQTKRVVFINGVGEGEKRLELEARSVFLQWSDKLEFEYTSDLSVEEMLQRIANLPPQTIALYSNVFRDKTGRIFVPKDVAEMVARAASTPVFGMYNTILGSGIIGGSVFDFEIEGARAGSAALDILRGKLSLTKPVTILTASRTPMFDWQQLKRWGVNRIELPKETIFVNRSLSFWDKYKTYVIGVAVFLLAQSILIVVLLLQIRSRKLAEESLRQKTGELDRFFDVNLDLLCIANTDGYFVRLNPAWERILGHSREELMAKRFLDFVHPDDLDRTREAISTLASQQKVFSFGNRYRCKDGAYRWIEWNAAPAGNLIYAAARDVTERKRAEEALWESEKEAKRIAEEALVMAEIGRIISSTLTIDEVYEPFAKEVKKIVPFDRIVINLIDGEKRTVRNVYMAGPEVQDREVGRVYPLEGSGNNEIFRTGRPFLLQTENFTDYQERFPMLLSTFQAGFRSMLNVPLISQGQVIGGLLFRSLTPCAYTDEHVRLAEQIGRQIAGAIVNAELFLKQKKTEEALKERLRFEQLLSNLSSSFVNIPPDQVDSQIEKELRQILEFFEVERCGLIQVWPEKVAWMVTHVALAHDIPSPPIGVELSISIVPWVYDELIHKGETMAISRLDDLPAEANKDKQTWIEWGVQSGMYVPIMAGESASYVIAIDSMTRECVWPKEIIPRLRMLGEILVNALERKRAEAALRESERELRQSEGDLRKLAGRLISAQEEERSRLARELHDDFAQRLAVFAIDVGRLEQQLMDPPAPVQEKLREMKEDIVRISQDVHSLSRQLHPSILDDLGLIKAVESECTNFSRREGIEIVFNHENIPTVIPKGISLSLYRIIQEGLRNISQYACAEHISVSLKGIDHDVLLSVQDDGIGFDSAEVKEKPGLGLSSMRERARLIHGELSIKSQPEKGTVITVRAPLMREGE